MMSRCRHDILRKDHEMKIAIAGAGALGCLFGGKMVLQSQDVIFYDAWEQQVEKLNADGMTIVEPEGDLRVTPVRATLDMDDLHDRDLIFLFVKSYDNAGILPEIQRVIKPDARVITMQNGLGNAELIASFVGERRTLVGVTFQGGTLLKPGRVEHKAFGSTSLANYKRQTDDDLLAVVDLLQGAGFDVKAYDNVDDVIWTKLVQNAAYNALTAITRLQMGRSISGESGQRIAQMVIEEIVAIASRKGIKLYYEDPVRDTLQIIRDKMPDVITSMLSDVLKGRRTEIDSLNGAIVREGKALGIPVVANEMLTCLIRTLESSYDDMLLTLPD